MESANRDEAERCLRFAKSTKDVGKARRFAEKSYRLCPTPECRGGLAWLVILFIAHLHTNAIPHDQLLSRLIPRYY